MLECKPIIRKGLEPRIGTPWRFSPTNIFFLCVYFFNTSLLLSPSDSNAQAEGWIYTFLASHIMIGTGSPSILVPNTLVQPAMVKGRTCGTNMVAGILLLLLFGFGASIQKKGKQCELDSNPKKYLPLGAGVCKLQHACVLLETTSLRIRLSFFPDVFMVYSQLCNSLSTFPLAKWRFGITNLLER